MMSLYACSEQRPPNKTGEFKLYDGESTQLFTMPKELKIEQQSQSRLFFVLAYPSMTGRDPQRVPQGDEISVWISLEDRIGSTEYLVKAAAEKIDLSRPGQVYRDGREGEFEVFRGDIDKKSSLPQEVTYVFLDDHGELVGIEDAGSWSGAYSVRRKIGTKIHVRYLIEKPIGRDFKKIDKTVKEFIFKHAKGGIQ
jgi:hypothetical protein